MPSEKPRIAAYISKELDERVKAFQAERGLKSESQALTVILSEFFGPSQEVAHSGSLVITELSDQIEALKSELLNELNSRLRESEASFEKRLHGLEQRFDANQQDKAKVESSLPVEPTDESPDDEFPGQLKLIPSEDISNHCDTELQDESDGESSTFEEALDNKSSLGSSVSKPLDGSVTWSGAELSKRFGVVPSAISNWWKKGIKPFSDWTRRSDPDSLTWKRVGKQYLPIVETLAEDEEF